MELKGTRHMLSISATSEIGSNIAYLLQHGQSNTVLNRPCSNELQIVWDGIGRETSGTIKRENSRETWALECPHKFLTFFKFLRQKVGNFEHSST